MGGGNREPKVLCGAFRGRYLIDGKRQDHKMKTKGLTTQRLEVREDGKTNTLTTVQKDNVIVKQQHWRRLSPKECERLMTVEDDATLYGIDEDGKEIKRPVYFSVFNAEDFAARAKVAKKVVA